jgi:hypothetical protein
MSLFAEEIARIQNPAYGSVLVYSLAKGYQSAHPDHSAMPLSYVFIAIPLLLSPEVIDVMSHTRSGLRSLADKLNSNGNTGADMLITLMPRVRELREFTLACIKFLLVTNLVSLDTTDGTLVAHDNKYVLARPELPPETKQAEQLGKWLAVLSPFELSSITKVVI